LLYIPYLLVYREAIENFGHYDHPRGRPLVVRSRENTPRDFSFFFPPLKFVYRYFAGGFFAVYTLH